MEINFAKSTEHLNDAYFIVTTDYYYEPTQYAIIPKSMKLYTKDIDFISDMTGWIYEGTDEEFQEYVNSMDNGNGYEYIHYWDGHNSKYIDLNSDYLDTLYIDTTKLELIDIYQDSNPLSNEYALVKDTSDNSFYVVYGTSCRQEDVFAEIKCIGKNSDYYYSIITSEE